MVEELGKVKNINRKAKEGLPLELCGGGTMNDMPSAYALPLKGEQAACTCKLLGIKLKGEWSGTLEQPMGHSKVAENEGRPSSPAEHADEVSSCMKQHIPNACRVLLKGENARWLEQARGAHRHSSRPTGCNNSMKMATNACQNVRAAQVKLET
ncbi:hypothetical protein F5141DRAFT_1066432 [Pisolithus sp. B1]|nr:hypothetical protein F5141DRAFT_1066432 [Pisolithus sp. B1]